MPLPFIGRASPDMVARVLDTLFTLIARVEGKRYSFNSRAYK